MTELFFKTVMTEMKIFTLFFRGNLGVASIATGRPLEFFDAAKM